MIICIVKLQEELADSSLLCSGTPSFLCNVSCMSLHDSCMLILVRDGICCCHKWLALHWLCSPLLRGDPVAAMCACIKASDGAEPNRNPSAALSLPAGEHVSIWGTFSIWPRGPEVSPQTFLSLRAMPCQDPTKGLGRAWAFGCHMLGESN